MPNINRDETTCTNNVTSESTIKKRHRLHRKRSEYKSNQTAALSLNVRDKTLIAITSNQSMLFAASQSNILYHTANRVDLFFYTLIAYYNTNLTPHMGSTFLQYGKGRHMPDKTCITQANHSSLFGSFTDETSAVDANKNTDYPRSILSTTHFLKSLNATVELPAYVNAVDCVVENDCHCRHNAMIIIQEVARGLYDPIEGLKLFFQLLNHAFIKINRELKKPTLTGELKQLSSLSNETKTQLMSLIEKGTFHNKWNKTELRVENAYIELLLRLTPDEKKSCKQSSLFKEACYEEKMIALQAEILGDNIHVSHNHTPNMSA